MKRVAFALSVGCALMLSSPAQAQAPSEFTTVLVPMTMAEAWPKLLEAYKTLQIPMPEVDSVRHIVNNPLIKARGKLGKIALSSMVSCGGTASEPYADTYQLTLSIQSRLTEASGGVMVETLIDGSGQNLLLSNNMYAPCRTLGSFEKRVGKTMTDIKTK